MHARRNITANIFPLLFAVLIRCTKGHLDSHNSVFMGSRKQNTHEIFSLAIEGSKERKNETG
jgi:hypothetical protein